MPRIDSSELEKLAVSILTAAGATPDDARTVARSLVLANLRGHDSHGVMRIPSYLDKIRQGEVISGAPFDVSKDLPSIVMADGNWGFGQVQLGRLMEMLIDRAKENGLVVGTLIRTTHVGRLGEYCEMAAAAGLLSQIMVNTHGNSRHVAPVGGKEARLGTNPVAFGVPSRGGLLLLDFATSATSEGKVRLCKSADRQCPEGWLVDSDGRETTDPHVLYGSPRGAIRPMGGDGAYKGFGLALMIELFAGALSGGVCMREIPLNQKGNCTFVQLLDPGHFGGVEHFAAETDQLCEFIRACPRADGVERIVLPGDPEEEAFADRSRHGIPIDDHTWNALSRLAPHDCPAVPV